jgi:hypothetical protein
MMELDEILDRIDNLLHGSRYRLEYTFKKNNTLKDIKLCVVLFNSNTILAINENDFTIPFLEKRLRKISDNGGWYNREAKEILSLIEPIFRIAKINDILES